MLQLDHCIEERWRLGLEADNLCRWFGCEILAAEIASALPSSKWMLVFVGLSSYILCRQSYSPTSSQP